ncbi:hypothetical protein FHE25_21475 [Salmonella enterica]|nr:hypothetical protein [Salmonella enterica]EAV1936641.1 hypothetical protein [Salmonella enterica]EBB7504358.1 hypothetical protein [Salmonella enterica]EDT0782406.1 hypothetical protein [Salmonella enterica]
MNNFRVQKLQFTYIVALLSTIVTLCLLYASRSISGVTIFALVIAITSWSIILISSIKTRNKINNIVNSVYKNTNQDEIVSIYNWLTGRYFGINKTTGDILVIALNRKGQHVFGFDYKTWSGYEISGNKLTLKFNNLDMPYFEIHDVSVAKFKHKLDVFLSNVFQRAVIPNKNFSTIVEKIAQTA